ncbi:uncharacterized protein LOC131956665 [Physella acuta]|uniref:uncharacterized protein LOC131956665 n=1 Tax=Physella acuta TaxID=109671 RepID=UPI0027DC7F3F|nr:uncharacterized protein LOC131956665 [Physella acuta]
MATQTFLSPAIRTPPNKSPHTNLNKMAAPRTEAGGKPPSQTKPELTAIPQTNFAIGLLVTCCFNLPFGLLALYFSLRAAAAYRDGQNERGAIRAKVSIFLSLMGIMLTMILVSSYVVYIAVHKHSNRGQRRPNASALGF